jgi:hypothetical protein
MKLCVHCNQIYTLYDDIDNKVLMYQCKNCDINIPVDTTIIFSRIYQDSAINNVNCNVKHNNILMLDPTLPKNNSRVCAKCNTNNIVSIRNSSSLLLNHYCSVCSGECTS